MEGPDDDDTPQEMQAEGFAGYEPTSVDPSPWLLFATAGTCVFVMLIVLPIAVAVAQTKAKMQRKRTEFGKVVGEENKKEECVGALLKKENAPERRDNDEASGPCWRTVLLSCDEETQKILRLGIPYTVTHISDQVFSNVCLILVAQCIGTKAAAAYALVCILVELSHETLSGIISSCGVLCAHAVGAGNSFLAGQYVQLAVVLYLSLNVPVVLFWWNYMYRVILYLQWEDEVTAQLAQSFTRSCIWSFVVEGITMAIWELLEVTDHAGEGAALDLLGETLNVLLFVAFATSTTGGITLHQVGILYTCTALLSLGLTMALAQTQGWLKEFNRGIFHSLAVANTSALNRMIRTAIPLAGSSLSSSAEWAVLTVFASSLGPAEVAAWAILGNIWDLFFYLSAGFGAAAEIRTALHLGHNHPKLAELSAHKSLLLGFVLALTVSGAFFSLRGYVPAWYTRDAVLQEMLRELVPLVGISNLAMSFGMDCWSLVDAQGRFGLAMWITWLSTWGISMPLAALFAVYFRFNLLGLVAASTLGYVTSGACLSYIVLTTNWQEIAKQISEKNALGRRGAHTQSDVENPSETNNAVHGAFPEERDLLGEESSDEDSAEEEESSEEEPERCRQNGLETPSLCARILAFLLYSPKRQYFVDNSERMDDHCATDENSPLLGEKKTNDKTRGK